MEKSIQDYLATINPVQLPVFENIRATINGNIPEGFKEVISYDMIGYVIPLEIYPPGYRNTYKDPLPLLNLGSQKNYISMYHYGIYADTTLLEWFVSEYAKSGYTHKLNMGKSCIRFIYMNEIPLTLIGQLVQKISVDEWIAQYREISNPA